jgi:hypothetical protein
MTPKEKAIELIDRFSYQCLLNKNGGKVAALIAVHEIISLVGRYTNYWQEVKEEIYKL